MTDKPIDPINDPRVSHHEATLNGNRFRINMSKSFCERFAKCKLDYLLINPTSDIKETIFLIHGWPDLSVAWRNQVPLLMESGYRVVCMDNLGHGRSDSPRVPPTSIEKYSMKNHADAIKALAIELGCDHITVGGHDWGGFIAYRAALWHPEFVTRVFSVCSPYLPPTKTFTPTETLVHDRGWEHWGYQLQFKSGIVEEKVKTKGEIKKALNAAFGGSSPEHEYGISMEAGFIFDNFDKLGPTPIMDERTLDFYVEEFSRNGMHQTKCWYSSFEQNFKDELALTTDTINIPVLFIQATQDAALPPEMSKNMDKYIPRLTKKAVDTGHWALWTAAQEVNEYIAEWLAKTEGPSSNL